MSGIGGLAEGFLAGFNTMNNYQRGQKADERADKELSLRDAQWQNILDRQKVADQRYTDETAYRQGRDNKADQQWQQTFDQNKETTKAQLGISKGHLALSQAQNTRQQQLHDLTLEQYKRKEWESESMPLIQSAYSKLQEGQPLTPDEIAVFDSPYGKRYDPSRVFGDPKFGEAITSTMQKMVQLGRDPEVGKMDMPTLAKTINTPDTQQALSYLLRNRLEDGIGTATPNGVVSGYGAPSLVPTGRGTFVIEAPVTYIAQDGTEVTKVAPITQGRSGDNGAQVMEFSAQRLAQWIGSGYQAYKGYQENPGAFNAFKQSLGLAEGADYKGYRSQVVKLQAEENKAIDQIRRDGSLTPEQQASAIQAEREATEQQVYGLADVFGIPRAKQGGTDTMKAFVDGDPIKAQFVAQLSANAPKSQVDKLARDPEQLAVAYNQWLQQASAAKTEQDNQARLAEIQGSSNQQSAWARSSNQHPRL
ncbi:hypothetical protein [Pseudaeromonas paramecii]|uniref:Uncharacterized protein n=1 Tax=Pseudaeromonas paramecii TaxID=2138166 RepID=A0ABP8PYC1_9GAMM